MYRAELAMVVDGLAGGGNAETHTRLTAVTSPHHPVAALQASHQHFAMEQ